LPELLTPDAERRMARIQRRIETDRLTQDDLGRATYAVEWDRDTEMWLGHLSLAMPLWEALRRYHHQRSLTKAELRRALAIITIGVKRPTVH
jgi:hypothetical protein